MWENISSTHQGCGYQQNVSGSVWFARIRDVVLAKLDRFPFAAKDDTRITGVRGHHLLATALALPMRYAGRSQFDRTLMKAPILSLMPLGLEATSHVHHVRLSASIHSHLVQQHDGCRRSALGAAKAALAHGAEHAALRRKHLHTRSA